MDRMTLGIEEAACRILERLGHKLSDAEVDYESFAGMHNFIINHAGTRFRVQFAEQTLLRKSADDQKRRYTTSRSGCFATVLLVHCNTKVEPPIRAD